jgi:hypothetical protein
MTDRASVFQGVQIGVEATYGVQVPANKLLRGISIEPSIQTNIDVFRAMGVKYASVAVQGREWVQANITGSPTFDEIVYLLSSVMAQASPAGAGVLTGTAGAYTWTFNPASSAPDTIKSFTVEHGSSQRSDSFTGGVVTAFNMNFTREKVDISGTMIGQLFDNTNPAMTAAPAGLPLVPIAARYFDVFLDNTSTGLGTTKLTRPLSVGFSLDTRFAPVWAIDSSQNSFAALVETAPKAQVRMMVEADAAGMAILDTMRAGGQKFMRVATATTGTNAPPSIPTSAPAAPYGFELDMSLRVTAISQFRDQGGVYAVEYTFDIMDDTTWGKAMSAVVVNGTSAL